MKFEKPIAEVERFSVQDVISASGETEHEYNPEEGTIASIFGDECTSRETDNYNFNNCL